MNEKEITAKKEQLMLFAIELAKQSRENLEELLKLEADMDKRDAIVESCNVIEQRRNVLKRIRREYAVPVVIAENREDITTMNDQDKLLADIADAVVARKMAQRLREDHLNEDKEEAIFRS